MNRPEMQACPFCGGKVISEYVPYVWRVRCAKCGMSIMGYDQEHAENLWCDRAGERKPPAVGTVGVKALASATLLAAVEEVVNHYQIIRASDRKPTTLYLQDKANEEKLWKLVIKLNLLKVEWEKAANNVLDDSCKE
ncbi:MAG: hypothetical protein KGL39_45035 [Patescibacteria group bacterium]|nr:hypothetical protein [Patescibacteria group bacterium]